MKLEYHQKMPIKNRMINKLVLRAACLFMFSVGVNSLIDAVSFSSKAIFTEGVITARHSKKIQPKNKNAPKKKVYSPVVSFKVSGNKEETFTDQQSMDVFDFPRVGTKVKVIYLPGDLSTAKIYYGALNHYMQPIIFISIFLMLFVFILVDLISGRAKEDQT